MSKVLSNEVNGSSDKGTECSRRKANKGGQEAIMKEMIGTSNRVLEVDLTRSKVDIYHV